MVKDFILGKEIIPDGYEIGGNVIKVSDIKKAIQILKDKIYSGEWANNMDYAEMRGNIIDEINKVFGEELK